jgi:carbon storage regulator
MLILSRRIGETFILELPTGEQINVVLLEAKGSRGRIGIDAPPEVHIVREELLFDEALARQLLALDCITCCCELPLVTSKNQPQ